MRRRALVLAAGEGRRLRPLTAAMPKPMVPVLGRPILAYTLDALVEAGVEACAINLHHCGELIESYCGAAWRGMRMRYSAEPVLLGTLGALAPVADFLAAADEVLLVNGDSLCHWPLERLAGRRRSAGARVALLLAGGASTSEFGGGIGVDRDGRVRSLPGLDLGGRVREEVFAGAHVLDPALVEGLAARPSDIVRDLYRPLLERGELITSHTTNRRWADLGTPERYRQGVLRALAGRGSYAAAGARIAAGARVVGSVIEAGARLETGSEVRCSVVLAGAVIGAGARVEDAVIGPGLVVPANAIVRGGLRVAA